jgi:predicted PurR-regulated permease PerM
MKNREAFPADSLILEKLPAYFLFAAIFWVAWNLFHVVQPFMMIMIFSGIIATITFPIYAKFETWFGGRKRAASILTTLLVIFAIVIPILLFLLILAGQARDLYGVVNTYLQTIDIGSLLIWEKGNAFYDLIGPYSEEFNGIIQQNIDALRNAVAESAKYVSTFAARQSAKIVADLGLTIFNLLLMFFTLYFLYKDGRLILRKLMLWSPISVKHQKVIFKKFREISQATLFGTFLTAIAQGIVGWIGFSIAGVPSAFFWGTAVSVFSLVPTVGTAIVWFPMGIIMLASGNWMGLFVLIWGGGLISTVDNLLRVVFIGATAKINPLLTFLTIFGGILAFGLIGVVFGPMLLVLFLTFMHIYELEYGSRLGEEAEFGLDEPVLGKKK